MFNHGNVYLLGNLISSDMLSSTTP